MLKLRRNSGLCLRQAVDLLRVPWAGEAALAYLWSDLEQKLYAEDMRELRQIAQMSLTRQGHSIECCVDGREASGPEPGMAGGGATLPGGAEASCPDSGTVAAAARGAGGAPASLAPWRESAAATTSSTSMSVMPVGSAPVRDQVITPVPPVAEKFTGV